MRYEPIVGISTGYDSPAAAVLSRAAGCTEAYAFREARGTRDTRDDGENIAAALGMKVTKCDRLAYLGRSGFYGDKVWDRNCDIVSRYIRRGDSSGSTYAEMRLRVGFFHLPVPFVGSTSHPSIHRISRSQEMLPWSLGNSYDRPIPRRLLEESGAAWEWFGMKKRAVGVYVPEEGLRATMTPESYGDFARFAAERWNWRFAAQSLFVRCIRFLYKKNKWLNHKAADLARRALGIDIQFPVLIPRRLRLATHGYLGREALLFHWSAGKILPRYEVPDPGLDSRQGR